jgi:hypothetical protein
MPRPIRRALGRVDRRLRGVSVLRGLGAVALLSALGAAGCMAIDFAWWLPRPARWAAWLVWVTGVSATLAAGPLRGVARRHRALELAAVLERSDPKIGERLTGAVGLLAGTRSAHGSPALIAALVDEAASIVANINLSHIVPARVAWRRFALGMVVAALVVAPGLLKPDPFGTLARRFLMPWADISRVSRHVVSVAPGDAVIALGDDLTILAEITPRFGRTAAQGGAWVEWADMTGRRLRRHAMEENRDQATDQARHAVRAAGARAFRAELPRLAGSITYRVVSQSGESRRFRVKVVPPPAVAAIAARVEPPAYTKRPAALARDPARIVAFEGSRVTLTITTAAPVRSVTVTWPEASKTGSQVVPAAVAADGRTASVTLPTEISGEYAVSLRDGDGLASRPEPPRRLVVRPDEQPVVAVRGMEGIAEARSDDTLRIAVATRDDVAVASAELHYEVERAAAPQRAAGRAHGVKGKGQSAVGQQGDAGRVVGRLSGLGTPSARGELGLGLKALGLMEGDVVSVRVRVSDNRPAPKGPNVVWSSPQRLSIVARGEPLWARRSQAERKAIQERLDGLKRAAAQNRHETELLRYAADAVLRGNAKWDRDRREALADREAAARALSDELELLARDLEADPAFHPLARPARQVAQVEAEAVRATLDQAKQAEDDAKRLADLRQADLRQGAVSTRLDELQRAFDALAERAAEGGQLQALADREAQAAERAEALADPHIPPDRARLDQLEAEQNAVRNELDALLKKSPELRAGVLSAQAGEAEALAHRARAVAERQREQSRQATDLSRKADVLKQLADEQRAIEDEARRLALDVDAPLVENARGRLNTEPIRQAAEPIEQGDLVQGRQQLQGAEAELRRVANDLEDTPRDVQALARRLAARQDRLCQDLEHILIEAGAKTGDGRAAADRPAPMANLKPLAARQRTIAALAGALLETGQAQAEPPDAPRKFPREEARDAAAAAAKSAEAFAAPASARAVEQRAGEARNALLKLAGAMVPEWHRQERARRAIAEAKRAAEEVGREVDRHLRETEPLVDKEPDRAAAELARRLAPLAEQARRAGARLGAGDLAPRVLPQRDRAGQSTRTLADAIEAARAQAVPDQPRDRDREHRDALAGAVAHVYAAFERLEQKVNNQVPLDDVAAELAEEQRALSDAPVDSRKPANERVDVHDQIDRVTRAAEQRRIATALRSLRVPDAPLEHVEAILQAERAALALERGSEKRAEAAAVAALSDRLNGRQTPRARVEALARSERGLSDPDGRPEGPYELPEVVRRQRAIAAELVRLPHLAGADEEMMNQVRETVRQLRAAAERALRADDTSPAGRGRPTPTDQAEALARITTALDTLATRLPGEPVEKRAEGKEQAGAKPKDLGAPRDPELAIGPAQVAQAQTLARRERRLRERLQAVLGEEVAPQEEIRRDSVALGRALADLRDRAGALSNRAQGPADEAAALLGEHAPRAMDAAADQLAQGQPTPARDAQRRAAELAERGAQHAEDLAAALRADRPAGSHANAGTETDTDTDTEAKHRTDPGDLAAAREAVSQASRRLGQARGPALGQRAMSAARQAMQGAAERLQAAADARSIGRGAGQGRDQQAPALAQAPPATGQPDAGSREPRGTRAGIATPDELHDLQALLRKQTGRKWGELPGHLRTEILQMSQSRYRDDYARLIQLYFREIAAGADARRPEQP